jgi:hypothetical protein
MQVILRHDVNERLMSSILGQDDEFEGYMTNTRVVFAKLKRHEMWFSFVASYEKNYLNNQTHNQEKEYKRQIC